MRTERQRRAKIEARKSARAQAQAEADRTMREIGAAAAVLPPAPQAQPCVWCGERTAVCGSGYCERCAAPGKWSSPVELRRRADAIRRSADNAERRGKAATAAYHYARAAALERMIPAAEAALAERMLCKALVADGDSYESAEGIVSAGDFAAPSLASIFRACAAIRARGDAIEVSSVVAEFLRSGDHGYAALVERMERETRAGYAAPRGVRALAERVKALSDARKAETQAFAL